MSRLVKELKKDHVFIFKNLNEVKNLGVSSKQGNDTLLMTKRYIFAHIKKEDEQLYPFLKNAAERDANLKQTLDMFAKDMDNISKNVLDFFKKYTTGGAGIEFARDFGKLFAVLYQRLKREENIIYAEYDKLKQ